MTTVWTETYRPRKLDEIIGQQHIISRLKAWVKEKTIPNMLFAGPAGVGKTTTALALARELFGDHWRDNFQETNASDDRGINVVRGRIKEFASTKPIGAGFKIVFLDESDALTSEAQQALRRTIEKHAGVCRFILSCNYSNRIIEPIQSRTAVFRFKRLDQKDVETYLQRIVAGEKLKAAKEGLQAIINVTEGDLRKATNLLQAAAAVGSVDKSTVLDVAARAEPEDVKKMMELARDGKFTEARKRLHDLLIVQGFSGEDIVKEVHRSLLTITCPEEKRLDLLAVLGETEFRLTQGSSPDIQLEAFLAQMGKK
ncbi:MAG: replication factor C small subunit [Nanoarchaeota archaeon]|nr:replication factor C small subunit [Nanoarchaeota archaeon]